MNRKVDLGAFVVVCMFAVLCMAGSGVMLGQSMNALAALRTACVMSITEAGK